MCKQDYYQILGVNQNANEQDIKRAFVKLAFQYHPEINPGAENEGKFKEIYKAYAVLKDAAKRQEYDQIGHDEASRAYAVEESSLDLSLESIVCEILGVAKDASEQDIDKAVTKLASQYRSTLKDLGYRSISDISGDDMNKFSKLYKAYAVIKEKAKRREDNRPDQDASSQESAEEPFFTLTFEDILYEIKKFAKEIGLSFDEESDPLGISSLGEQIAKDTYWYGEHFLSDVLGIKIRGKVRRRRVL